MPDDLYSLWLKVPPGPRPPDHYALLGLPRFCDNQEQIEAAAQRQLDELDRHALHNDIPKREACHQMMNEVARARVGLTNPKKRALYDLTLDPLEKSHAPAAALPTTDEPPEHQDRTADWKQKIVAAGRENPLIWLAPTACIAIVVGALIVFFITRPTPHGGITIAIPPAPKSTLPVQPTTSAAKAIQPRVSSESATKPSPSTKSIASVPIAESPATYAFLKPLLREPVIANRKPIPSAEQQDKSTKLIDQIYGQESAAAQTAHAKSDLARKMLAATTTLGDDDIGRFVLLKRAADLAVDAWDLHTAVASINAVGREFDIDSLKIKARAFGLLTKTVPANHDQQGLAQEVNSGIDQSLAADRYDIATYLIQVGKVVAQAASEPNWIQRIDAREKELAGAQVEFDKASAALSALANGSDDANAISIVGRFRCFVRGDWENGLPLLAAGSDAACKTLALAELKHPADTEKIVELADGWWDLRDYLPEFYRRRLTEHAGSLYSKTLPLLTGGDQVRAQKRIDESNTFLGRAINLLPFIDLQSDALRGKWIKQADGLLSVGGPDGFRDSNRYVRIGYRPPDEYDFRIEFVAPQDRTYVEQYLSHDGHLFGWQMGQAHYTGFTSHFGFDCVDGHFPNRTSINGPPLGGGQTFVSVVKVRRDSITAFLNDQRLSDFKTDYSNLVLMRQMIDNPPQDKIGHALGLGGSAYDSNLPVLFTKVELIEVSGHGSPITNDLVKP